MKTKSIYFLGIAVLFGAIFFLPFLNQDSKVIETISTKSPKYDHPEEYEKFHTEIRTKFGDAAPTYPSNYQFTELQKAKLTKKKSSVKSVTFQERGPYNVPGRTRTVLVDPSDATNNTWYAGAVSGGVWKTTDAGQNWTEISTDLPNLSASSLVMAPSNQDVMYLATGEGAFAHYSPTGGGIFKSTDRGQTWDLLTHTSDDSIRAVSRIIVDPNDENIVLASVLSSNMMFYTNNGTLRTSQIIKSIDGGQTWYSVYKNELGYRDGAIQHLIADPSDFNTLYASVNSYGVLKSTDKGETWTLHTTGFASGIQRIELAIAQNNTSIIYASVQGQSDGVGSYFYMSVDAGETWDALSEEGGAPVNWLGTQGWYDNTIIVNPFADTIVYVGGIELWKITVLGLNDDTYPEPVKITEHVSDYYNRIDGKNNNVHVDHHTIVPIINGDEFSLLNGNDGGLYLSDYSDDPGFEDNTWTKVGNGYNTSQFYGADKKPGMDSYLGGTQDNGTWWSQDIANPDASTEYLHVIGGDGFEVVCHYENPDMMIGGSQYNNFVRTEDNFENTNSATEGLTGNMPFISRLATSKSDPDIIYAVSSDGVFKSDDFGKLWYPSKVDETRWGSSRWDIEVSESNPQIVWAGQAMTSNLSPQVSTDGGFTFSSVSNFKALGYITSIATHPKRDSTAYLLFSVDKEPKILVTHDLGETWSDLSGFDPGSTSTGFPNVAVFSLIVMPYDTDVLWAGTEIGIFESTDNGVSWSLIDDFPSVCVWEMKIVDDQVVIATYGRGIWSATIAELADYEPVDAVRPPRIKNIYQDFLSASSKIIGAFDIRDSYDSLQIIANEEIISVAIENEIGIQNIEFSLESDEYKMQLVAFVDGVEFQSIPKNVKIVEVQDPTNEYIQDFNTSFNRDHITGDLFTANYVSGFLSSQALHSPHNYENNSTLTTILAVPLIISQYDSKVRYKDVAIIEPGEPGSEYGNASFYDYVVVEATNNSLDWIPISGGYDARYDDGWLDAYNTGENINEDLFVDHEIDLHDYFSINDTILIRFRLFADPAVNAWGWVLDDFEFVNTNTGISGISDEKAFRVYPNPAKYFIYIKADQVKSFPMEIFLYDTNGRMIMQKSVQATENLNVSLDVSSQRPGIYILSLKSGSHQENRKIIIE